LDGFNEGRPYRRLQYKRKEDRRRIVERYVSKVFIKELQGEEGQNIFQINLIIKIGGKTVSVGFEYNKKSLALKLIEKDFYIPNDNFVKSSTLVYKNEVFISIKLIVRYNKNGRFRIFFDKMTNEIIDF
jgi:hypothetical protein